MKGNDPYVAVNLVAEQVIQDQGITELPVDPTAIARNLGIEVLAKPIHAAGVSGMFFRVRESYGIAYATHIDNIGFQNFSVAHELGHYFLPGHVDAVLADGDNHESRAGFTSSDRHEMEADRFAARLLMPNKLFSAALRRAGDGLAAIETLHNLCKTSLTATAIRFTQCTRDPVAIIVSMGNRIDYCFMSDALKGIEGIDWIRKHETVPSGTTTFTFNQDATNVQRAERVSGTSNLQAWFGGRHNTELSEDVIGLGSYGKTLTVLCGIELLDENEEEDEDSLAESWQPKFRR